MKNLRQFGVHTLGIVSSYPVVHFNNLGFLCGLKHKSYWFLGRCTSKSSCNLITVTNAWAAIYVTHIRLNSNEQLLSAVTKV